MINSTDIIAIAEYCQAKLNLAQAHLSDEYYYQSLPLCVIDTVFSIGVRYTSTEKTVTRFCEHFSLKQYFHSKAMPPISVQVSISDFIKLHDGHNFQTMADQIYENRQRTSSRGGILKAEAVLRFAEVLSRFEVNYYQDIDKVLGKPEFEAQIATIPGQGSGISTRYFYMLAGSEDYIKPDRMVARFIWAATQRNFSVEESHTAIIGAHRILAQIYPALTPRALDHQIWLYQREQKA